MRKSGKSKHIAKEEKKVAIAAKRRIRDLIGNMGAWEGSQKDMLQLSEHLNGLAHQNIDIGYIKTLLFPELYNADIPQPMSTQSYCRFSDKREMTFASNSNGLLLWFPKTVIGPQLFIRTGSNVDNQININEDFTANADNYKKGGFVNYSNYFSQVSLVSASLSIQYIGQLQAEQGYMVGGQVYGVDADLITPEYVETGQFRFMARPGDGMRTIYLPKDSSDFQYYSCIIGQPAEGKHTKSGNQGAKVANSYTTLIPSSTKASYIDSVVPSNIPMYENDAKQNVPLPIDYALDCDIIAIYWKGLSKTADVPDLRIDITRKFNGFPIAEHREILDLVKPKKIFDPKKTVDVVCELQDAVPQLAGHSLKAMDRISDQIQEFLPNIGFLYNEGLLKEGTSLDGFAQQLQGSVGNEGQTGFIPGRVFE